MHGKVRDVIILDEEDDVRTCNARGAYPLRDFSSSDSKRSSLLLPRTLSKRTLKAHSLTNNLDPADFEPSHWSFAPPAATRTGFTGPSRPASISQKSAKLGCRDSADATMASSKSSLMSEGQFLLPQPRVADLTDDYDSVDEDTLALWITQDAEDEMRRSSLAKSEFKPEISQRPSTIVPRNLPITPPFVILDTFTYNDFPLTEKVYVELEDGDFLRIIHIVQDTSTLAVTLRGWKFRRTREMNAVIEKKLNEVCWILHIDDDDPRDAKLQGMETVSVREVVKRRRIRLTNQSFPALSWRDDGNREKPEIVENDRVLVCRFKYICVYADAKDRALYKWREKGFHRLREDDCDQRPDNNIKDEQLRNVWRGYTVPGGAQEGWLPGEREFLRQEDVSHRGIASRSSLKAPSGQDFALGDPMKRGSVGSLLTGHDLQQSSDRATQSTSLGQRHSIDTNGPLVSNGRILHSRKQRHDRRRSHYNFTGFNGLPTDSRGYDTDDDYGISDWRRGLRQSSIQPRYSGNRSPRIVEIDAQVKTSSSSGTFEKRYEGKITSTYYPTPVTPLKRKSSRTLPGNNKYPHEELATSSGDRILGRSQSPDSVEETFPLSKSGGYKTSASGLLTPVSGHKGLKLRRSQNAMRPPRIGDFSECTQQSRPSSRTARSSVVSHTQTNRTTEDDNSIVDLTRPQANSYGSFSGGRPSTPRHSGASKPLYESSVRSQNPYKTSSSRRKSPRPTYANPRFNSDFQTMPIELRQNSRMISPGSLTKTPRSSRAKANQRRYTVGDCFCGAGGMSRGAVSAGLRLNWGFDFNPVACQTYGMNFFGTPIYNVWAHEFSEAAGDHKVDICHLSPPCQYFSDAHTIQGKDDDMNTASLFAIFNLLEKAKPRIVTLEQTSGLLRRHPGFFNTVINMFTSRGFSVRWKIMNCADFGLPQRRTRVFIMASCPGEVLPPFPPPTHSSDPEKTGLKPWTTINEAIAKIPHGWPNHDIHLAKERNNPPQSGDKIATCVTTSGGGIIHPSGKRDYTHREFACLQGFPLGHKFGASGVKKQLGNAVPPAMAKILLETVRNALLNADGLL